MIRIVSRTFGTNAVSRKVYRSIDLPAPTVAAGGMGAANTSQAHWEDDGMPEPLVTTSVDKPPYRIPSMDEIRAVEHNGLNVASLFAGGGGSSTGYRMAGYRVLAAVEFVPAAADTYQANAAEYTTLLRRDVRELEPGELLDACGLAVGELDVLDGSPPCEPFSMAGKRDRQWNQVNDYSGQQQRSDDLFFEYARLLREVQPRVFVAENVPGLARGRARGYFLRIMAALRGCGYRVQARVLDASWLGVPQERHRIIFVGVREDLDGEPVFPTPLPYRYTVRDALGDLLEGANGVRMGSFTHYRRPLDITDRPAPTVVAGDSVHWHVDEIEQVYTGSHFVEKSRSINAPAATVVTASDKGNGANLRSTASQVRRRFTIEELRRICGFPDDYVLLGSRSIQWERLGDAVPPPMAAAWATTLANGPLSP